MQRSGNDGTAVTETPKERPQTQSTETDVEEPSSLRSEGRPAAEAATSAASDGGTVVSIAEVLWSAGLDYVKRKGKLSDAEAREMIGGWRKRYGDGEVAASVAEAQKAAASDPVPYITAVLQKRRRNLNQQNGGPTRMGKGI